MNTKKAFLLVVLITTALLFVSCKQTATPSYSWEKNEVELSSSRVTCHVTNTGNISYCFCDDSYEEKKASKIVYNISSLLSYSSSIFSDEPSGFKLYFGFDSSKKDLYNCPNLPFEETFSMNDIWRIVKKAHLPSLNAAEQYGLFYEYSKSHNLLNSSETLELSINELQNFFNKKENLILLDMVLPMIDENTFSKENVNYLVSGIMSFSDWFIKNYSLEEYETLCRDYIAYDKSKLVSAKNNWLESIHVNKTYTECNKLPFTFTGNNTYSYSYETEDAIWSWANDDIIKKGYQYMIDGYNLVKDDVHLDFKDAQNYLKDYLPSKLPKVHINLFFSKSNPSANSYRNDTNTINIYSGWEEVGHILLHEYIHYLTKGDDRLMHGMNIFGEWLAEGVSQYYIENRTRTTLYLKYLGKDYLIDAGYWDTEKDCYSSLLGGLNSLDRVLQSLYGMNAKDLIFSNNNISYDGCFYLEMGLLYRYVIENYGMNTFIKLSTTDISFEDALGVDFNTLYRNMLKDALSSKKAI